MDISTLKTKLIRNGFECSLKDDKIEIPIWGMLGRKTPAGNSWYGIFNYDSMLQIVAKPATDESKAGWQVMLVSDIHKETVGLDNLIDLNDLTLGDMVIIEDRLGISHLFEEEKLTYFLKDEINRVVDGYSQMLSRARDSEWLQLKAEQKNARIAKNLKSK
jgi:hypothetical protein